MFNAASAGASAFASLQSEERDGVAGQRRSRALRGADAYGKVRAEGYELVNAGCIFIAEQPRIGGGRDDLRARLAETMGVEAHRIGVDATTTDRLGFTGRGEGPSTQAVVLLER